MTSGFSGYIPTLLNPFLMVDTDDTFPNASWKVAIILRFQAVTGYFCPNVTSLTPSKNFEKCDFKGLNIERSKGCKVAKQGT